MRRPASPTPRNCGRSSKRPGAKKKTTWPGRAQRLDELGSQPSVLNPLWYAGAYVMGAVAARIGDPVSLGFVVETERQVEAHLNSHLELLPQQDAKSRAIVDQMRIDEIAHGDAAQEMGAAAVADAGQGGNAGDGQGDDDDGVSNLIGRGLAPVPLERHSRAGGNPGGPACYLLQRQWQCIGPGFPPSRERRASVNESRRAA